MSAWIARGPETGRLFDLGAGAMSGADPFNLVVGALIPVGRAASIGGQIARRFGADLAANLVGEVPGLIQRKREQQELPTAGEVVVGAATGALLSTGIHTAFEVALRRGQDIVAQKPTPVVRETTEAAIRMHESGAKIDVTPAATLQAVRDAGGVMTGVENPHEFRQLGHPSEAHYYIGLDPETGKPLSLDDLGGGIVGVDNKAVANNGAGLPESAFNGKVVRADLSADANLVDSEMSLKDFFGGAGRDKAIEKIAGILGIDQRRLSQYHDRFRKLWTEKGTVRDLFNLFQDAATDRVRAYNDIPANDFRKLLDGMGYDGMNFTGHAGDTPIDNRIVVFNEEKLSPVEVSDAAKNEVPQFTVEQQKAASERAQAPEQERWFDQNAKDLVKEKALVHDAKVDVTTVDQNIALAEQNARIELAERAIQNPELADEIALADREFETAQYEVEAVKNMAKCMEGAVV